MNSWFSTIFPTEVDMTLSRRKFLIIKLESEQSFGKANCIIVSKVSSFAAENFKLRVRWYQDTMEGSIKSECTCKASKYSILIVKKSSCTGFTKICKSCIIETLEWLGQVLLKLSFFLPLIPLTVNSIKKSYFVSNGMLALTHNKYLLSGLLRYKWYQLSLFK